MNALPKAPSKTRAGRAHRGALTATLLIAALLGCSREEKVAATAVAADAGSSDKASESAHPEDAATGSYTVTEATPAVGNGTVTVTRRYSLAMPGQPTILTIEGHAGELKHSLLVFVDSAGGVIGLTHQWQKGDEGESAVVTECKPCAPAQVTANAKTGEVTLRGLLLADGIDRATGQSGMQSTLTGHVLP